jgi:uncharacterized membrane protein YdjX (TVP38/TMEM64 family)
MTFANLINDRRLWVAAGAVALFGALHWSGLTGYLSLETLRIHREALTGWVAGNTLLAALAFVGIYAVAVAFSLPGASILTLAGGFLFGTALGAGLTVVAATIGATLVFLFARTLLGENALDRFGTTAAGLAEGIRRNAASYLLVLRLAPLFPFFLVNLVPAFVGVPLGTYVLTTFFGIIPATIVFSLAGAGLGAVLDKGGALTPAAILTPEIIAGLFGLAALSLLAIPLKRRFASKD